MKFVSPGTKIAIALPQRHCQFHAMIKDSRQADTIFSGCSMDRVVFRVVRKAGSHEQTSLPW